MPKQFVISASPSDPVVLAESTVAKLRSAGCVVTEYTKRPAALVAAEIAVAAPKGTMTSKEAVQKSGLTAYRAARAEAFRVLAKERGGVNPKTRPSIEAESHAAGMHAAALIYRSAGYTACPADACDRLVTPGYAACPRHS